MFLFSTFFKNRLVSALWSLSLAPFYNGYYFWLVPFIVPHFGGILAVFTYKFGIVSLRQKVEENEKVEKNGKVEEKGKIEDVEMV